MLMKPYKKDPSRFHRTLGLSYPIPADAEKGLAEGVISKAQYAKIVDAARRSWPTPWRVANAVRRESCAWGRRILGGVA